MSNLGSMSDYLHFKEEQGGSEEHSLGKYLKGITRLVKIFRYDLLRTRENSRDERLLFFTTNWRIDETECFKFVRFLIKNDNMNLIDALCCYRREEEEEEEKKEAIFFNLEFNMSPMSGCHGSEQAYTIWVPNLCLESFDGNEIRINQRINGNDRLLILTPYDTSKFYTLLDASGDKVQ